MNCIDVADAVVAELNSEAGDFDEFTAIRTVMPVYDLATESALKVSVVPMAMEISRSDRAKARLQFQVDIGIQQKLTDDIEDEVETLVALVISIEKFLRNRALSDLENAVWLSTSNDPIYSQEHLKSDRMFTSILTVTYLARD